MNKIVAYCRITDNALVLNGNRTLPPVEGTGQVRLTNLYRALGLPIQNFIKWTMSKAVFLLQNWFLGR